MERFQTALKNLEDCYEHLDADDLSPEEKKARADLVDLCCDISGFDIENEAH